MKTTPFDLTPKQKELLKSLSEETGKSIPILLAEALDGLREQVPPDQVKDETISSKNGQPGPTPEKVRKPIWEIADELFGEIPDEELERLPTDGSVQHDHYIYGTPKRPT
ncbi:MAG: hypothetical protein OEU26_08735 [Candidatus Tectomicrobia bacterium]|nr:hypothetical protein [Candidatus Tectomicrobia bacterium]